MMSYRKLNIQTALLNLVNEVFCRVMPEGDYALQKLRAKHIEECSRARLQTAQRVYQCIETFMFAVLTAHLDIKNVTPKHHPVCRCGFES